MPLSELAASKRVAILAISHFNKGNNAHADYKITDSLAFVAAARAVSFSVAEPDTDRMLLMAGKTNISQKAPTLAYRIRDAVVFDGDGGPISTSQIEWLEVSDVTAEEAFASKANPRKLEKAEDFLRVTLMDGPALVSEIKRLAGDKFSWPTVKHAKAQLSVKARKGGFQGQWIWELPEVEHAGE